MLIVNVRNSLVLTGNISFASVCPDETNCNASMFRLFLLPPGWTFPGGQRLSSQDISSVHVCNPVFATATPTIMNAKITLFKDVFIVQAVKTLL